MKKRFLLKTMLLLCALIVGSSTSWADPITLFHETFGDNSGSARAWSDDYSVKSGVYAVYSGITGYTVSNVKQGKNTTGSTGSGLIQSSTSTDAYIIIGPLNVSSYNTLILSYQWKAGSTKGTYSTSASYATSPSGSYTSLTGNGATGATSFVECTYNLPEAAQVNTLYLKIVWNTSNTQAIIDEVNLSGVLGSSDPSSAATFTNKTPSINYPVQKTYSQAPTTASGYSGAITYSITANTAGATIDSETGLVTVTKGGSVTVNAVAAAVSGSFSSSEDSYTLTVTDTRGELGDEDLKWSAASATVTYGADDNSFPTLTNTQNVTVTYESSNQTAATIDATTGDITLKDVSANSTTSIKAIFNGNDDYLPKTISYTLTVNKAPFAIKDGVFDFVEAAKANPVEDYGSGVTLVSTGFETESKTWTAGNVTMVTSRVSGNGYRWWEADGTLRFYNKSTATFSVPSGYVITKIVTTGANFDEANVGLLSSSTWTGASKEVALSATDTRNIKTITVSYTTATQPVTITATGYNTFSSNYPLDLSTISEGATAYVATGVEDGLVKLVKTTAKVPAGTGLFIKGTANETYTIGVTNEATTTPTNLLVGAPNGATVGVANEGFNYVFGWADVNNPGFYLINASSATLPAGKAYLHTTDELAVAGSRLGIILDDGEVTGISATLMNNETMSNEYFDLQGRKVANPNKGLYIVNGRKVVIK